MKQRTHILEVWGDFACFSRPEMKVERFSYPLPTPSAARGIFDAIYCKPNKDPSQAEFRWQVTRIELLNPVNYIALRRNEVKDKANVNAIQRWMEGKDEPEPLWADGDKALLGTDERGRTQRQTMALKDVRYRIHARIHPWPGHERRLPALQSQFERRAKGGKCVWQPYFGCREFPAYFEFVNADDDMAAPCRHDQDLGLMLYDVFDLSRPGTAHSKPAISLFQAKIVGGVMEVPDYDSDEVLKTGKEVT